MAARAYFSAVLLAVIAAATPAAFPAAAEFHSTADAATVLYDAPSVKAKPLFALGRDYPLEVIVNLEGWLKVRDASGTVAWVEKKSVSDKHMLVVSVPVAETRANPDANSPIVFKAEQNVLLELVDPGYATATPGWAKVRHRDGQVGYVRIQQVWGL